MKLGMMGDVHGWYPSVKRCLIAINRLAPEVDTVYQLGDFGLYPDADEFYDLVENRLAKTNTTLYVTPGNHEDWDYVNSLPIGPDHRYEKPLRDHIIVLDRGWSALIDATSFVSLGGAPSVDRTYRQQNGWPWSEGETITRKDLYYLPRARVMLAHDAPFGSRQIQQFIGSNPFGFLQRDLEYADSGREIMTEAIELVRPEVFFHGHYHIPVDEAVNASWGSFHQIGLNADGKDHSAGIFDTDTMKYRAINWYGNTPNLAL